MGEKKSGRFLPVAQRHREVEVGNAYYKGRIGGHQIKNGNDMIERYAWLRVGISDELRIEVKEERDLLKRRRVHTY